MPDLFGWMNRGEHSKEANNNEQREHQDTTPADVQRRMAAGEDLHLLDVREPHEFREAHVPGSVLIPLGNLSLKTGELPTDKPIVVICRSGNRSGVATSMLRRAGFVQAQNMKGGIIAWARAGGALKAGK